VSPPGRPAALAAPAPRRRYWHAQAFADTVLAEFNAALGARHLETVRERFYILAAYYRRTLAILHGALEDQKEPLAAAALENLVILQRALSRMREISPNTSLSTLALETDLRRRVNEDLVYRILRDARGPLAPGTILRRFNELDIIADVREPAISQALLTLVQTGHVIENDGRYRPSGEPYVDTNVDRFELSILVGPSLARDFGEDGFEGLSSVLEQREAFRDRFTRRTGFGGETAVLAIACAEALAQSAAPIHGAHRWPHAELAGSAHPRPYQRLLHAIFRAHRYAAQVIEAPAGSGKTLVGMLCIEDWLRTMAPGESILVLVPTASYQRQWVGELCLKPVGLRMAPHLVFAGTPGRIGPMRAKGMAPSILVLTYGALARLASGEGRGGFDGDAIERLLQANNVRHVILDEAHKVAADLDSATAATARVFVRWLKDGSLASLIGFSGTLAGYERQLSALGLTLASVLPSTELIAQGWVAPFAEFGAPFNYSERELRILAYVDSYRALLRQYLAGLDAGRVRAAFAGIPLAERVRLGTMLGMYAGRSDAAERIQTRMREWESGPGLGLNDIRLLAILQLANGWPDARLVGQAGRADAHTVDAGDFESVRVALRRDLPPGAALSRVSVPGFGQSLDTSGLTPRTIRDALATTVVGSYMAIREWSRQAGEGRVSVVRAIIDAERRERSVSGVIIFDTPANLRWREGTASPGYRGAGGMFAELSGDRSFVPIAALGSELYLPEDPENPLHARIADWVRYTILAREQGEALLDLVVTGAGLEETEAQRLRPVFAQAFAAYAGTLRGSASGTLSSFDTGCLKPLREALRDLGFAAHGRLFAWLSISEHHMRASVAAILDYAAIASAFDAARLVTVACGDGAVRTVRVVPTGTGRRRQQLLDLTARIVDADELPVDLVIVSSWARTGWNVLTPNVLIDATATRDVTAWRQLRGRAMRPSPRWTANAQRLVHRLLDARAATGDDSETPAVDSPDSLASLPPEEAELLSAAVEGRSLLAAGAGRKERESLAAAVMLRENKVTHIYELVSARGAHAQVEYHRKLRLWERDRSIAAKHTQEEAVRASDGALVSGPDHAPLLVAEDPRSDVPAAFRQRLARELRGADERIVRGWLRAGGQREPGEA